MSLRSKDLILDGSGAATTPRVDAQQAGSAMTIDGGQTSACVVRRIVLTGGIYSRSSTLELNGGRVASNVAEANYSQGCGGGSSADVHLMPGSPGIDTGNPAAPLGPDGSRADMGAVPFDAFWTAVPASYCPPTGTTGGCSVHLETQDVASLSTGLTVMGRGAPSQSFGLFFLGTAPNFQLVPNLGSGRPNQFCVGGSLYGQLWYRQPSGGAVSAMSSAISLPIVP